MYVSELSISDARDDLADVVNRVQYAGERTYLTRHGRRVAAVVPVSLVDAYEELGKRAELGGVHRGRQADEDAVPWERFEPERPRTNLRLHLHTELHKELVRVRSALGVRVADTARFSPPEALSLLIEIAATQKELAATQERLTADLAESAGFAEATEHEPTEDEATEDEATEHEATEHEAGGAAVTAEK
jgi:prevent-host-death family protein